jgi:hypothetical protein
MSEKHYIMTIEGLDLSVRAYNCLKRAGIDTVDDITTRTEEDMIKVRNLGKKDLETIIRKLHSLGLDLKRDEDDCTIVDANRASNPNWREERSGDLRYEVCPYDYDTEADYLQALATVEYAWREAYKGDNEYEKENRISLNHGDGSFDGIRRMRRQEERKQ